MNQKSLNWGIAITGIWLTVIIIVWFFGGLKSPSSLNELGDALAGIVAPIAFLWLIMGYVQQGKQLDQNTKALEQQERALQLQIDEMQKGIEQRKTIGSNTKRAKSRNSGSCYFRNFSFQIFKQELLSVIICRQTIAQVNTFTIMQFLLLYILI